MKAARAVLEFLQTNGVQTLFGIPAGSVNAFFDELCDMPAINPVITKHEGAASYMAAAHAKYSGRLSVAIGCSGPGGTNLVTGAANAMREHLPVLFLTGAVPVGTMGLNASQELDAAPVFRPVTKYSVLVKDAADLLPEVVKACRIAISDVPGPVHIAIPIDVQHADIGSPEISALPERRPMIPDPDTVKAAAEALAVRKNGIILVGQGVRGAVDSLIELAETLNWPIVATPQAKGYIPDDHPLLAGVFGFAGHEAASNLIAEGPGEALLIVGSSLGETASSNYNPNLVKGRFAVQLDYDQTVFGRKYKIDLPVLGDIHLSLAMLIEELRELGLTRESGGGAEGTAVADAAAVGSGPAEALKAGGGATEERASGMAVARPAGKPIADPLAYNTQNVLLAIQSRLPAETRYTVDIGEFMSYVIHYMRVRSADSFSINVHFGAMGSGISSAIGSKLAEPERPVACITGDGCFFMHGMELLTAKDNRLPILFIVMNNARLGMVYHGHNLQFRRTLPAFEQEAVSIAAMAAAMGIPSCRIGGMEDIDADAIRGLLEADGPAVLEVALQDNNTPPMGDRVKFLSSFGK